MHRLPPKGLLGEWLEAANRGEVVLALIMDLKHRLLKVTGSTLMEEADTPAGSRWSGNEGRGKDPHSSATTTLRITDTEEHYKHRAPKVSTRHDCTLNLVRCLPMRCSQEWLSRAAATSNEKLKQPRRFANGHNVPQCHWMLRISSRYDAQSHGRQQGTDQQGLRTTDWRRQCES